MGDPEKVSTISTGMTIEQRLSFYGWNEVTGPLDTPCWEWCGPKDKNGYGLSSTGIWKKTVFTHRASYEHFLGPIPKGLLVRHKCDNPPCMNPGHLELGTHADNAQDREDRQRSRTGEKHPLAKLDWVKVREIRASEEPTTVLASRYGVHPKAIFMVRSRQTWKERGDA